MSLPATRNAGDGGRWTLIQRVALKFAFLGVLYLFLLVIARSALKDLRGTPRDRRRRRRDRACTPIQGGRVAATDATLVAVQGGGLTPGERIDLFGGVTIGRSDEADVRIDDRFSSGIHCRVHTRGNVYLVEDMDSTNGTYLNGGELRGEAPLTRHGRDPDRRHGAALRADPRRGTVGH